jgi:hypothetical protein
MIATGDLTHDGVPETVVVYTIEGEHRGNGYVQYLAVFTPRDGRLSPVTYAAVGGKGVRSVDLKKIENSAIHLDTLDYGPKDALCCPSVKGETRYVLIDEMLREEKRSSTE